MISDSSLHSQMYLLVAHDRCGWRNEFHASEIAPLELQPAYNQVKNLPLQAMRTGYGL